MKILCIGTLPPPNHGQSVAFFSALKALRKDNSCKVISTSFRSDTNTGVLIKVAYYLFQVPFSLLFRRPDKVYFLCSRTLIGGFRDVYLLFFCLFTKAEVFNHLHGSDFDDYVKSLNPLYRVVVILLYKRVNEHAVLINGMQEQLASVAKAEKISVVNNFYQESLEIEKNIGIRVFSDEIKIFYLSSIMTSKGIFELIEATKEISTGGIAVKLTIAGGFLGDRCLNAKETEEKFFSLIKDESYINYVGVVNIEEKYQHLGVSDILALPSYYKSEAVPLCIIEAMRMGCCILTTRYKYLPMLLKENVNGFLVEPQSVKDIVSKLIFISSNKEQLIAISKGNIKTAISKYGESKYHENIRKLLGVANSC